MKTITTGPICGSALDSCNRASRRSALGRRCVSSLDCSLSEIDRASDFSLRPLGRLGANENRLLSHRRWLCLYGCMYCAPYSSQCDRLRTRSVVLRERLQANVETVHQETDIWIRCRNCPCSDRINQSFVACKYSWGVMRGRPHRYRLGPFGEKDQS